MDYEVHRSAGSGVTVYCHSTPEEREARQRRQADAAAAALARYRALRAL